MGIAGLDADRFNNKDWIRGAAGSPYEFKMATNYACAMRVDNYSVRNLRLSLSGYVGTSGRNTLNATNKYDHIKGLVCIGAFDFQYANPQLILRGNVDYGHLSDSMEITNANRTTRKDSPSPKNSVAKAALAAGLEGGYDLFSASDKLRQLKQRLYLFGRYDYYDSMFQVVPSMTDEPEWERRSLPSDSTTTRSLRSLSRLSIAIVCYTSSSTMSRPSASGSPTSECFTSRFF